MGVDSVSILVCLSNRYVGLLLFRRCTCISAYDVFCDSHLYDHGFDLPVLPTCQNLRPEAFVRNNLLTRFIELFYSFDTNTNVCPSLHVIGSVAAMFGLWDCKALQSVGWKIAATSIAVCISLSTVFMKQHSIMDVLAALPVCFFGWWIAYKILPNNKTNRFLTRM